MKKKKKTTNTKCCQYTYVVSLHFSAELEHESPELDFFEQLRIGSLVVFEQAANFRDICTKHRLSSFVKGRYALVTGRI